MNTSINSRLRQYLIEYYSPRKIHAKIMAAREFRRYAEIWMNRGIGIHSLINSFKEAYKICIGREAALLDFENGCLLELITSARARITLEIQKENIQIQFEKIINARAALRGPVLQSFGRLFKHVIDFYKIPDIQAVREISLIAWMLNPNLYLYFRNTEIIEQSKRELLILEDENRRIINRSLIGIVYRNYREITKEIATREIIGLAKVDASELSQDYVNTILSDFIGGTDSKINNTSEIKPMRRTPAIITPVLRKKGGCNVVLYGVPGCGKSYIIDNALQKEIANGKVTRIIFHPEYSYYDFVGQMIPACDNSNTQTKFKFKEGPFAQAIKNAYLDPENMHYFIIEEINRGNSAAIFGDLFQLLDRDKTGKSTFEVSNSELAEFLYSNSSENNVPKQPISKQIRIPSNLTIVATMNTADQNVCPLDTAFQRRWHMLFINNDFNSSESGIQEQCNAQIIDTGVSWKKFCEVINSKILMESKTVRSTEDKCLGVFFMRASYFSNDSHESLPGIISQFTNNSKIALFVGKVIKYLWDDAFRLSRTDIFEDEKFDDVVQKFSTAKGADRFNIFKQEIRRSLIGK